MCVVCCVGSILIRKGLELRVTNVHLSSPSEHQSMQVEGLITTSNVLKTGVKQVTADTSHTLLQTMAHTLETRAYYQHLSYPQNISLCRLVD